MIEGDHLPTISAPRVVLRWMTQRDVGDLHAIFSNAEVMRYWSSPPLADEDGARDLLAEIHDCFSKRSLFQWGLAMRSDDRVIGTCTLAAIDEPNRRAELGFALGRDHWGKGYMAEALKALLDYAFETLNLRRLEADVDPRNKGSIRTLERLGFQREGLLRERWDVNGEIQDSLMYGLLRGEWEA